MILSAYRNPPYRSPTMKNSSNDRPQTKQPQPSPNKRKRSDSSSDVRVIPSTPSPVTVPSTPSPLRIDTVSRVQEEEVVNESGASSPRTKVARSFESLRLTREESPKKKLKRRTTVQWEQTSEMANSSVLEIGETPQPQAANIPTPHLWESAPRAPSPSPQISTLDDDTAMAIDTPLPDGPADELLVDRSALTWQDEEITGHEIDLTSPDDDGEGINGIGFKPTSAMAYARSQKRKQQVNDWKAREAKEARQRRMEKRRGGSGESDGDSKGRTVRFLDAT